jgi:hypothetical protein
MLAVMAAISTLMLSQVDGRSTGRVSRPMRRAKGST